MSGNDPKRDEWPNLDHDPEGGAKAGGAGAASGGGNTDREDLLRQFQELGQRLATTARTAWQSEQRQELQQEIKDGLRSVRDQLNDAIEGVRSSGRTQEVADNVKEQVNRASESVRSGDFLGEVRDGLATGLRELNEQLRRLSERFEQHEGGTNAGTTASGTGTGSTSPSSVVDTPTTTSAAPTVDHVEPVGTPDLNALPETPAATKGGLPTEPEGPATGERA